MSRYLLAVVTLFLAVNLCFGAAEATKTYGKAITATDATSIKSITSDPGKFVDKEVLISGKVLNVCKGMGCWVEVIQTDSSKIICKSLDESVLVPKDCEGREIQVQGKVVYDKAATDKTEMKKDGDGPAHACPAPKVLVSTSGIALGPTIATTATTSTKVEEAKTPDTKTIEVKATEAKPAEKSTDAKAPETTKPEKPADEKAATPAPQSPGK